MKKGQKYLKKTSLRRNSLAEKRAGGGGWGLEVLSRRLKRKWVDNLKCSRSFLRSKEADSSFKAGEMENRAERK